MSIRTEREKIVIHARENNLMVNLPPSLDGLVDEDIQERFVGSSVLWGDIINAQLIKTNNELIKILRSMKS